MTTRAPSIHKIYKQFQEILKHPAHQKHFKLHFPNQVNIYLILILIINNFLILVSKESQSVDDEEIDQNTFSVDQVSEEEHIEELENDDEDYEYLFKSENF